MNFFQNNYRYLIQILFDAETQFIEDILPGKLYIGNFKELLASNQNNIRCIVVFMPRIEKFLTTDSNTTALIP